MGKLERLEEAIVMVSLAFKFEFTLFQCSSGCHLLIGYAYLEKWSESIAGCNRISIGKVVRQACCFLCFLVGLCCLMEWDCRMTVNSTPGMKLVWMKTGTDLLECQLIIHGAMIGLKIS